MLEVFLATIGDGELTNCYKMQQICNLEHFLLWYGGKQYNTVQCNTI